MTADEAKQALKDGKKVRAKCWPSNDYIKATKYFVVELDIVNEKGVLENGIFENFKEDEWEIIE